MGGIDHGKKDGRMREPLYPLFIQEQDDKSIHLVQDKDLSWFEAVDVADGLYKGWDSFGHPLELCLEGKKVVVKVLSEEQQQDQMKNAILLYIGQLKKTSKLPDSFSFDSNDLVGLIKYAKRIETKSPSFLSLLKSLIKPVK